MQPSYDLSNPIPWRRSLRASQQRRAAAALRHRRVSRSRGAVTAALAGLAIATTGALAQSASPTAQTSASPAAVQAAQQALGVAVDGIVGPQTRRATRRFQAAHGLPVTGVLGAGTLAALGVDASAAADPAAAAVSAQSADATPLLESIALCESGGDPGAISPDGVYRGKYQFSRSTWRGLGGSGDPASASEAEQDRMAAKLMASQGPSAWPACSQKVGAR